MTAHGDLVLVRVCASAGAAFAGVVEGIGENVTAFAPGDEVCGVGSGAFAEYLCAPEAAVARNPSSLDFEQAVAHVASNINY